MSVAHELDMGGEYGQPAPVQLLDTTESLEWHYGHLKPEEIIISALDKRHKARIAQRQMSAAHDVDTYDNDAYSAWLRVYNNAIGPYDGNAS